MKKTQVFMKEGQNKQRIRVAWEGLPSPIAKGREMAVLRVMKLGVNFTVFQISR